MGARLEFTVDAQGVGVLRSFIEEPDPFPGEPWICARSLTGDEVAQCRIEGGVELQIGEENNGPDLKGSSLWAKPIIRDPLATRDLHRKFSAIATSREVLQFANEHGLLSHELCSARGSDNTELLGEPVRRWTHEITKLRWLIGLWDSLQRNAVGRRVQTESFLAPTCHGIQANGTERPLMDMAEGLECVVLAFPISTRHRTCDTRKELRQVAREIVELNLDSGIRDHCRATVSLSKGAAIRYVPVDLLGAIYLHFFYEVTGQSPESKPCACCGALFIPSHASQIYCKNSCNRKAYRQRNRSSAKVSR